MSDLTAVILCGGKGERLKPFTDHLPKALVPLRDKPLLYHLMNYLAQSGIARFVLCVGYKAECIEQFVRDQAKPRWKVECVNSGDASMADRILDAQPYIPGRGLICYGDILANVDLAALESQHSASGALATMTVYPLHSPFGIVQFDDAQRVTELSEKPVLPYWINIGFMLCEPEALWIFPAAIGHDGFFRRTGAAKGACRLIRTAAGILPSILRRRERRRKLKWQILRPSWITVPYEE